MMIGTGGRENGFSRLFGSDKGNSSHFFSFLISKGEESPFFSFLLSPSKGPVSGHLLCDGECWNKKQCPCIWIIFSILIKARIVEPFWYFCLLLNLSGCYSKEGEREMTWKNGILFIYPAINASKFRLRMLSYENKQLWYVCTQVAFTRWSFTTMIYVSLSCCKKFGLKECEFYRDQNKTTGAHATSSCGETQIVSGDLQFSLFSSSYSVFLDLKVDAVFYSQAIPVVRLSMHQRGVLRD